MKAVGKLGLAALAAIILTGGIMAYRTASFAPDAVGDGADINVAALPNVASDSAIENLSAAVRFKTVSHQEPTENDLSQWTALQSWLQSTYPFAHAQMTREMVAEHSLLYSWKGSDPKLPPIILMAHQDVVPVTEGTEKDWKQPPFSGAIVDGAVWGRGTVDDKGSLIALFEAVDALAKRGFKPKRTIYLVSGHDEEVGGTGAASVAALLAKRGVKALFTLDEGALVATDAPIINGPAALIGIAEKGYATLKVTANAQGGHSSMPPKETGVINLAKAVIAINDSPFPLEIKGPGASMLDVLGAKAGGMTKAAIANQWLLGGLLKKQVAVSPSGAALLHTTIAPTMLTGSPKENVLPQSATALINYRIAPWNTSADVMARAKSAVVGQPVQLSWVKTPREPTKISSTNSQGWNYLVAVNKLLSPDAVATPYLVVAGTDSRNMQGISDDVYRFMPFHFSLKDTAMIHGTNEHLSAENLKRAINFYAQLITTSAG